jgi:hypothetical protein
MLAEPGHFGMTLARFYTEAKEFSFYESFSSHLNFTSNDSFCPTKEAPHFLLSLSFLKMDTP